MNFSSQSRKSAKEILLLCIWSLNTKIAKSTPSKPFLNKEPTAKIKESNRSLTKSRLCEILTIQT